jgi:hypothetical protein
MQLIAVGDIVLNLDRISALDFDREGGSLILKVYAESNEPVVRAKVTSKTVDAIHALVAPNLRLPGADD